MKTLTIKGTFELNSMKAFAADVVVVVVVVVIVVVP